MAPPKPRPSFGEFIAPETPPQRFLDRADFAGKSPEEAVACLMEFESDRKDLEAVTRNQKRMVVRMVLRDLRERGKDLSSVKEADVRAYRAFLLHLVELRKADPEEKAGISQDYAAHIVSQWNSLMRAVFGDQSRPGEGLIMRNFTQSPKKVQRYSDDEMLRLIAALPHKRFQNQHYRELVHTYLELAWCSCGRIGSLNTEILTWEHVDWDRKVLSFKHMKNVDEHDAVLTDRCIERLRAWQGFVSQTPHWRGRATPILIGPRGDLVTAQFINRTLKALAAMAGVRKPITSHVLRKSGGTMMARQNPKLAQEQLGVTWKIFNLHYNQPMLEDRLERRDILPGATASSQTPVERIGQAYLKFQRGLVTRAELDELVQRATIEPTRNGRVDESPSYV